MADSIKVWVEEASLQARTQSLHLRYHQRKGPRILASLVPHTDVLVLLVPYLEESSPPTLPGAGASMSTYPLVVLLPLSF